MVIFYYICIYYHIMKIKSSQELKKINTKNLLAYYKAERKRFYIFSSKHTCDCCHQFMWEIKSNDSVEAKKEYEIKEKYLEIIKKELGTREHIKKYEKRRSN